MRWFSAFLLAMLCGFSRQPALANSDALFSGNGYYKTCEKPSPQMNALCLGYTMAVVDYAFLLIMQKSPAAPCMELPQNTNYVQWQDIFIDYLRRNPGERHMHSIYLFIQAMERTFPCAQTR